MKQAYTHRITYWTKAKNGAKVQASFPVTDKGRKIHLAEMQRSGLCYDIKVESLNTQPK